MELSKLAEAQLEIAESTLPYFSQNEQDRRKERNKGRDSIMGGLLRFEEEQGASTDRIYVASDKHLSILWLKALDESIKEWYPRFQRPLWPRGVHWRSSSVSSLH
jgi:hypothetical protein